MQALLQWTLLRQGLITRLENCEYTKFGPLHATDQTTPFFSLLARIQDFDWEKLKVIDEDVNSSNDTNNFTRLRCMRGTLHLIPKIETKIIQNVYASEANKKLHQLTGISIEDPKINEINKNLVKVLENGPKSSIELKNLLANKKKKQKKEKCPFFNENARYKKLPRCLISKYLDCLSTRGFVNYGTGLPKIPKTINKNTAPWRLTNRDWSLNSIVNDDIKIEDSLNEKELFDANCELCLYYFTLYGPASLKDFIWWTGLPVTPLKKAFQNVKKHLTSIEIDGCPEMFILTKDFEEFNKIKDEPFEMTRFLPYEDALVKAYKETRNRFWDFKEEESPSIYKGVACPTVWIDGKIIGQWHWNKKSPPSVEIRFYDKISDSQKERLEEEAKTILNFIDSSDKDEPKCELVYTEQ